GFHAAADVPDAHGAVLADRDDALIVGRERHAGDSHGVTLERLGLLLSLHVPHFHQHVGTGGCEILAIRAVVYGVNRIPVRAEVLDLLAVGHVPQAHRFVGAAGSQLLPIGAEGDAVHDAGVALDLADRFAVGDVPQANGLVVAGRGEGRAV